MDFASAFRYGTGVDEAIYNALKLELESAKERHEAAKAHVSEVTAGRREAGRYTAGMPEPDGSHIIRKAILKENDARRVYLESMMRLSNYLLTGHVPEHLKRPDKPSGLAPES